MKLKYSVNNNVQFGGDHEVHNDDCLYYFELTNKTYLGEFASCRDAVQEAKKFHQQVNGCKYCCRPCHTS